MPTATAPFVLNNVSLTLKTTAGSPTEYRCQLNRAELVPAAGAGGGGTAELTYETFCDTHSTASSANTTWSLELSGFQSFADASDLSMLLFTEEGNLLDYVLSPRGGTISSSNPAFTGQVTATPTAIGGTANQYAQFTASLRCSAKPVPDTTP